MTILRDIFARPVDRSIEGVIKADDDESLRIELEEYVLTNEIEKQIEKFLDAYNNYATANGVWISGFFGSGKSHLLKILAMLLENREVDGVGAYELFKDKCSDNEILAADLKKAVSTPSTSILFNIDQKADVIAKDQMDALLAVFQKVFDETCGYYGKQAHIAQFERDLDGRGVYDAFKAAYERIATKPWERGREQALLEGSNIASAYAEAAGTDVSEASGLLTRYRSDHKVSIEDFATKVKDYVDARGKDYRLNFFVDEVGQYIADNVKLMTNLQTIAESLNTKCRGQAWIIVTSQQDMQAVIGDLSNQQENDFSKIMARFSNRMPLNSQDVAEVIQKRLLTKTEPGINALSKLYHEQANNLKTLFDFADGSRSFKNFQDREHFIQSYPFIPYQYELFQSAILGLSQHNAFEGRHSSVGERSMLGVFQEVAIRLADLELGKIATFDLMFEGIRTALKSSAQQSVQVAERNLEDPFAIRILKALFLVKYEKSFKPTVRNIAILMLEEFDTNLTQHRRRIEEALSLLEQNTYIQRNGDLFEFLTDEEKDVEQEIKAVDVDSSEISKQLEELVFDGVIKNRKIQHERAGYDYSYARRLDDRLLGRDHELAINVISPFHEHSANADLLRMSSMTSDELLILLKTDERFARDLLMYKKTEKYVRQTRATAPQPSIERIIGEKGQQNATRYRDLATRARSLVAEGRLFVRGEELEVRGEDAQVRIEKAFQTLVDKVYTNLGMLRGATYTESDIGRHLSQSADGVLVPEAANLTEAQQEILNFAQANARTGVRSTVKAVLEKFESKPYGWPYAAILCNLASLFAHGKIEARSDGSALEGSALDRGLRNSQQQPNIVLDLQVEYTPAQVRKLRQFYVDMFDRQPAASEGKAIGKELGEAIEGLLAELSEFEGQVPKYPFMVALTPAVASLREVNGKSYDWYFTSLSSHEDTLLDAKEQIIDPIKRFMGGAQRKIYDEARDFLAEQDANLSYASTGDAQAIRAVLDDPACHKGNSIQQAKSKLDALKAALKALLASERKTALEEVGELKAKIEGLDEFKKLEEVNQAAILQECEAAEASIRGATLVAIIRERSNNFRAITYPALLGRISQMNAPEPTKEPPQTGTADDGDNKVKDVGEPFKPAPAPTEFVSSASLKVEFSSPWLANEDDVDAYLQSLRETLLAEIHSGKRITV